MEVPPISVMKNEDSRGLCKFLKINGVATRFNASDLHFYLFKPAFHPRRAASICNFLQHPMPLDLEQEITINSLNQNYHKMKNLRRNQDSQTKGACNYKPNATAINLNLGRLFWQAGPVFMMLALFFLSYSSCERIEDIVNRPKCNNHQIMEYASLADLQAEYNQLKTDYENGGEVEELEDFENRNAFYSCRKKDYEMDEGIIADEPNFDSWLYSSDDVTCTILNPDGMVIIGQDLYVWSDGCVGFKVPFDCNNYDGLKNFILEFHAGTISDAVMDYYYQNYDISHVDLCSDEFDLESNWDGYSREGFFGKKDCELESNISFKILSNNEQTKIMEIELTATNMNPGLDVLNTWYINNVSNEVTIIGGSGANYINQLWNQAGGFYVGEFVRLRVDYNTINYLDVLMEALNEDLGCDKLIPLNIDLLCPVQPSALPINMSTAEWFISIEGLSQGTVGLFEWNFGDGTVITSSNLGESHNFPLPCVGGKNYTVTISDLEGTMPCNFPLTMKVYVRNPCYSNAFRNPTILEQWTTPKVKHNGRKVVMVQKLKANGKIKHKMKHRKNDKRIEVLSGDFTYEQGTNCLTTSVAGLMSNGNDGNPASHNKKRKLKQRYRDGTSYYMDYSSPHRVRFSTASGFQRDVSYNSACLSVQ